jgi:hypothetical protein
MLHGLIFARQAKNLATDPAGDFLSEVRDYFGSGTQLQEMYVTPSLLRPQDWDALAEAARWSRGHAATLVDTHWIGGDPVKLEPYGWASWSEASPGVGLITLRNPSDRAQSFSLNPAEALELPEDAWRPASAGTGGDVVARSPWASDAARPPLRLRVREASAIELAPFEVRTMEIAGAG